MPNHQPMLIEKESDVLAAAGGANLQPGYCFLFQLLFAAEPFALSPLSAYQPQLFPVFIITMQYF